MNHRRRSWQAEHSDYFRSLVVYKGKVRAGAQPLKHTDYEVDLDSGSVAHMEHEDGVSPRISPLAQKAAATPSQSNGQQLTIRGRLIVGCDGDGVIHTLHICEDVHDEAVANAKPVQA
ncbi:hypothetical protein Tco_0628824 [Tanacetum coccineum]|uniref:Uncharacterized protein n=1 Tax=Tanacetum coccineum TaxID=301880 RepID=A0ABQ4WRI3_9ASTR